MANLRKDLIKAIHQEIESSPDDEDSIDLFEERINELGDENGWSNLVTESINILLDTNLKKCWHLAASVVAWSIEDNHKLPCEWSYLVAVLYLCLEIDPNLGSDENADAENLVWSISQKIKGVDYLSDWDPLEDREVLEHMEKLKKRNY